MGAPLLSGSATARAACERQPGQGTGRQPGSSVAELAQAMAGFSWAMSLLAARQLPRLLAPCCDGGRQGAAAFEAVTHAAESQLPDVARSLWAGFDEVQRAAVDWGFDLLRPEGWASGEAISALAGAAALPRRAAGALASLAPGTAGRAARGELASKWRVYWLVRGVEDRPRDLHRPLPEAVAEAYRREPFAVLFELEGLGHDHAAARCREGEPRGLLTGESTGPLPPGSLLLLHAGMGMAFAEEALRRLSPASPPEEMDRELSRFAARCRDNARPGYAEAALEALGLVARTYYPRVAPAVARRLAALDPELAALYWHGAGRAIYFLPAHALPGADSFSAAVARSRAEAPPERRCDALEGLVYAACMVNLERPEVFEMLVRATGESCAEDGALAGGVRAALAARADTTPDDPAIAAFLGHRPGGGSSREGVPVLRRGSQGSEPFAAFWEREVRGPAREGLAWLPALRAGRRLGALARHRSRAELLAMLEEARS